MNIVKDLNEQQVEAVVNITGPALVLAGPGSGKTRLLTYRIAYLIENIGIQPEKILGVTFTNKAAGEMKERINRLLPKLKEEPRISTFHSFCLRLLREVGFRGLRSVRKNFVVYDEDDSIRLTKEVIKSLEKDEKMFNPARINNKIDWAKNFLIDPAQFQSTCDNYYDEQVAEIFFSYQEELEKRGGLDFSDLIFKAYLTLKTFPNILSRYQEQFQYILVDEFQDTNYAQYQLVRLLGDRYRNLFVVGDEDQSIYSWRGANPVNIQSFISDYPDHRFYQLFRNYRSTGNIVRVTTQVISGNKERIEKEHWTENTEGEYVMFYQASDDLAETYFVGKTIKYLKTIYNPEKIAVLYRVNAQSRLFEEVFIREGIEYTVVGGPRFYQRKEIKDVVAYMRFLFNQDDEISLQRIINVPKRGIGDRTLARLKEQAGGMGISTGALVMDRIEDVALTGTFLSKIKEFRLLIDHLRQKAAKSNPSLLLRSILDDSGYLKALLDDGTAVANSRIENLQELISAATGFSREYPDADVASYIDHVSLLTDLDEYRPGNRVTLMTIHSAKGLEFDVVFLVGFEENLLPHKRSLYDNRAIEEERRLCFVAMTRAARLLYLTCAARRSAGEEIQYNEPSRFIKDIDNELLYNPFEISDRSIKKSPVKGTSSLKIGSNLENIKEFFRDRNIDIDLSSLEMDSSADHYNLVPGVKVKHPIFGRGKIISIEGNGKNRKAKIVFDSYGLKTIMIEHAQMEIIT